MMSILKTIVRNTLGIFMITAGVGHFTFARQEFRAQVPKSLPFDPDTVVLGSGAAEIGLGLAMLTDQSWAGKALAAFFIAIFPGNIAQYLNKINAFGLDTDQKRWRRLFLQPVLILLTIWSTRRASR